MKKATEASYHNEHIRKHGCYEVHPNEEYLRILRGSGILNEEHNLTLDVGCGSGAFGLRLACLGSPVVGIDISSDSIRIARKMAKEQGLDAEFIVGDIEKMPFRDEAFYLVFCGFVLHHVPNLLCQVAQQIYCILKEGGKLFMCEPNAHSPSAIIQYNFGKSRTPNEKPLNPKKLAILLSTLGFAETESEDIGDVKHLETDSPTRFRKIVRLIVAETLSAVNKIPFVPGPYFTMRSAKKSGLQKKYVTRTAQFWSIWNL